MLTEDEVALVFRRAAELEAQAPGERAHLDLATLEQIAVEAGLSPAAVRQAVDELRTGRLLGLAVLPDVKTLAGFAAEFALGDLFA